MAERNLKPRTPGEPIPAKQMPPQAAAQDADDPVEPQAVGSFLDSLSEDEIAILAAELMRRRKVASPAAKEPGELPDQSEIDPGKIKRAVLSRQGWVCPLESGNQPKIAGRGFVA